MPIDWDMRHGNCLEVLQTLPADSVEAIVTDPPYGLRFMGRSWDYQIPSQAIWEQALRVLKPGGHMLSFGGSRTFHRMACTIEDAGFEIRDTIMWIYGSGFPKSHNVANSIDKLHGAENRGHRIATAGRHHPDGTLEPNGESLPPYEARTEAGRPWQGFGTALKPAYEPICVARKPLDGTIAANVLKHGCGGINIDGCRIAASDNTTKATRAPGERSRDQYRTGTSGASVPTDLGRWPANVCTDGSAEVLAGFPDAPGQQRYVGPEHGDRDSVNCYGDYGARPDAAPRGDSGSAARFFYTAKADKSDRANSKHPTVKPTDLMRWLVRLVTPPGGTVLDPFAGTGSTGLAADQLGFNAVLIEQDAEYVADIRRKIEGDAGMFAEVTA